MALSMIAIKEFTGNATISFLSGRAGSFCLIFFKVSLRSAKDPAQTESYLSVLERQIKKSMEYFYSNLIEYLVFYKKKSITRH
jgi:hypothetical protein